MHNINQMQQVLSSLSELIGDSETATIHLGKETVALIRGTLTERQGDLEAHVRMEGSSYTVRLFDMHGLELPAWLYGARFDSGVDGSQTTAYSMASGVAKFINGLGMPARIALYNAVK